MQPVTAKIANLDWTIFRLTMSLRKGMSGSTWRSFEPPSFSQLLNERARISSSVPGAFGNSAILIPNSLRRSLDAFGVAAILVRPSSHSGMMAIYAILRELMWRVGTGTTVGLPNSADSEAAMSRTGCAFRNLAVPDSFDVC